MFFWYSISSGSSELFGINILNITIPLALGDTTQITPLAFFNELHFSLLVVRIMVMFSCTALLFIV